MLNQARLPERWRLGIWAKAAATATFNENLLVTKDKPKPSYELIFGKEHPHGRELRVFGEMGVVTLVRKINGKLVDRGINCMFVGYSENHPSDVYRMFDFHTRRIKQSRNIEWLGKTYGELKGITKVNVTRVTVDDDMEDEESVEGQGNDQDQGDGLETDGSNNLPYAGCTLRSR